MESPQCEAFSSEQTMSSLFTASLQPLHTQHKVEAPQVIFFHPPALPAHCYRGSQKQKKVTTKLTPNSKHKEVNTFAELTEAVVKNK